MVNKNQESKLVCKVVSFPKSSISIPKAEHPDCKNCPKFTVYADVFKRSARDDFFNSLPKNLRRHIQFVIWKHERGFP